MKRLRRPLAILLAFPLLGGCAGAGGAGAAGMGAIGGLFQAVLYLAMLIGPMYLSYYMLNKDD